MSKFIFGLLTGIVLCGIAFYVAMPKIKQTGYDSGVEAGTAQGVITGKAAGMTECMETIAAKQKHERDSIAVIQKKQEAQHKAAMKPKKKPEIVQNWHVIDGQLAEPVVDSSTHNDEKEPKEKKHKK